MDPYYLLDIISVNAQTLWALNNDKDLRKVDSMKFGMSLARALFIPAIQARSITGLSSKTLSCCFIITGDTMFASIT